MFSRTCLTILSPNIKAFRAVQLDNELKTIVFSVLIQLCGRVAHLPNSYLLSDKFGLSGISHTSSGFSDVRKGSFKGRSVAVKTLRVSESGDKLEIRKVENQATGSCPGSLTLWQRFCEEVAMWKNLSHPNVLHLIGVADALEEAKFSMVSEWMDNGDIMKYVRANGGNHLKLVGYNC